MGALSLIAAMLLFPASDAPWDVSNTDRYCTLTADLGGGAGVILSRSTISPDTLVTLVPPLRESRDPADPYAAQGSALRIEGRPAWQIAIKGARGGAGTSLEPVTFRTALGTGALRVTGPSEDSVIAVPTAAAVEPLFETCLAELRRAERGSGEPAVTPARAPTSLTGLLREHMPDSEQGITGWISVKLTIAAQGHLLGCEVTASSGDANRDAWPCRILMPHAHFVPATDAAGKPTLGSYEFTLTREQ